MPRRPGGAGTSRGPATSSAEPVATGSPAAAGDARAVAATDSTRALADALTLRRTVHPQAVHREAAREPAS